MTDQEWTEVHALSGAYAVDALDDLEKARFEQHLHRCAECRAEVDSLREAAAVMSVDDVAPPSSLRADVLAGIEQIRPLPPLTTPEPTQVGTGRRVELKRRWSSAPLLVAAALVLVALAATAWIRPWQGGSSDELTAAERVIQADDVQRAAQRFADGSKATVYLSRSEGRAVVKTDDMALAPAGKVYELWLQTPEGVMERAGLMPDESDTTYLLEGDASDATGVGITVEPDGGSDQPTTTPILLVDLSA
ncbi:anti-sigma factor [Nocardioides humilatus]|uniref:Regulator of SigK n=1 Tax=Nocardioides humilatus TaxID=2607660 RepID=A0A5B1LJ68_9ACTN|nr:anti-sigma factor [Nocardioides humilatus]KAA1420248.1 anti-sigma factor [Nocardioides humilatus]